MHGNGKWKMTLRFLHLFPKQLGINGETGNLDCMVQRLSWAGLDSIVEVFDGTGKFPADIDAVFIGSGTLAGAVDALDTLMTFSEEIQKLARDGVPILALGLGWEILGQSICLTDGRVLKGIGVFPSQSIRTNERASTECFGYDFEGNLTTGYANHASVLELLEGAQALIELRVGFGNSSTKDARQRSDEGLVFANLMAARLNGPLLPLNPHLADRFLALVATRSEVVYRNNSEEAAIADRFASKAREELKQRLAH
jgi:CobQ-like glutamine amidotransferase family enzyme